jgi:acyl carrier protein
VHNPRQIIESNIGLYHSPTVPNEITNDYKRSRHNQRANTSEGGHTKNDSARTSEGVDALTKSFSLELVPRQLFNMETANKAIDMGNQHLSY